MLLAVKGRGGRPYEGSLLPLNPRKHGEKSRRSDQTTGTGIGRGTSLVQQEEIVVAPLEMNDCRR